ncbi:tetratricopeptide repeat protein [Undibacterium sp.]|uniref:tetratricopeptide repeat protein n=1 Tax=Undibacterium sp. TaxID=1914977 RepID=UPI002C0BCACD|nr:tetratricopeptide repeat protein [Undibacterium sp.]HTD06148.1 tetratricopeptide repeat protein [Undibacterium sp.]
MKFLSKKHIFTCKQSNIDVFPNCLSSDYRLAASRLNIGFPMKVSTRLLCSLLLLASSAVAWADDFLDGVDSYEKKDYASALKLFKKAAKKGNSDAQFNLGLMYVNGEGVKRDYDQALRWYEQSAVQGNARAQLNYGRMFAKGLGVSQDYDQARAWYRKSAAQGYPDAEYTLGIMYFTGIGAVQNFAQAESWFRKAALKGNASSQHYLGLMYFRGNGVAQDDVEALKWFILADGYKDALEYREYAEAKMSKEQIAQAKKLAEEWRPN